MLGRDGCQGPGPKEKKTVCARKQLAAGFSSRYLCLCLCLCLYLFPPRGVASHQRGAGQFSAAMGRHPSPSSSACRDRRGWGAWPVRPIACRDCGPTNGKPPEHRAAKFPFACGFPFVPLLLHRIAAAADADAAVQTRGHLHATSSFSPTSSLELVSETSSWVGRPLVRSFAGFCLLCPVTSSRALLVPGPSLQTTASEIALLVHASTSLCQTSLSSTGLLSWRTPTTAQAHFLVCRGCLFLGLPRTSPSPLLLFQGQPRSVLLPLVRAWLPGPRRPRPALEKYAGQIYGIQSRAINYAQALDPEMARHLDSELLSLGTSYDPVPFEPPHQRRDHSLR
jgi:hypothetical protein